MAELAKGEVQECFRFLVVLSGDNAGFVGGPVVMRKVVASFAEAVADIPDGAVIAMMSFTGPGGVPQNLIRALAERGPRNLTLIACGNLCFPGRQPEVKPGWKPFVAPKLLVQRGMVRKIIFSWGAASEFPGEAPFLEDMIASGEVEIEVVPMGVLAHRLRAGGSGVPAFYSPIGVGTPYAAGKEVRTFDGRDYLLEPALRAEWGFVRAHRADWLGNLVYRGTSRGWNPLIAKASDVTIVETSDLVEPGALRPDEIVTPGIYVDRIVLANEG